MKDNIIYKIMKLPFHHFFQNKYESFLRNHDWDLLIWEKSKLRYKEQTGRKLNYKSPTDLNEKLMWLTRYWQHPLKTLCADKLKVREYLTDMGLSHLLVPLIEVYEGSSDINFENLPNSFVLKCNHGSGFNIICTNKDNLDIKETKGLLTKWLNTDYYRWGQEIHYKGIKKKIICEELISNTAPIEYQFWCINGAPDSILICQKRFDGKYESCSYSLDGKQLYERKGEETNNFSPISRNIKDMIEYAKLLSKPFPFVRADFYEVDNRIYFAELTFTPSGNILFKYKEAFINRLGKNLILPPKYKSESCH